MINIKMKYDTEEYSIKINDICCICLEESSNDLFYLDCNHFFHKDCITKWMMKNKELTITCPLCRNKHVNLTKTNNIYEVYDKYNNNIVIVHTQTNLNSKEEISNSTKIMRFLKYICLKISHFLVYSLYIVLTMMFLSGMFFRFININKN